jgi:hypothetical protein
MDEYSLKQEKWLHVKLGISSILLAVFLFSLVFIDQARQNFPLWFLAFCFIWMIFSGLKSVRFFRESDKNNMDESSAESD